MKELVAIARAYEALVSSQNEGVLATVVGTNGSTYRRAGARMLVGPDGWLAGAVSGGCLERHIVQRATFETEGGPLLRTYDTSSEDADFGLGCGGSIDVLFQRVGRGHNSSLAAFAPLVVRGEPFSLATAVSPGAMRGRFVCRSHEGRIVSDLPASGTRQALTSALLPPRRVRARHLALDGDIEVLVETIDKPQSLVVFGHGYDVVPLAELAVTLGWSVRLVTTGPLGPNGPARLSREVEVVRCSLDDLARNLSFEDDPACVVMTHDKDRDREILRQLLCSSVSYVGLLGPKRRAEELRSSLATEVSPVALATWDVRVHGPVGLDLGAIEPEEIALSIVAEIQSVSSHANARELRTKSSGIHESLDASRFAAKNGSRERVVS